MYSTTNQNITVIIYIKIIQNTFTPSKIPNSSYFIVHIWFFYLKNSPIYISHALSYVYLIKCKPNTLPSPPSSQRGLFHRDEIKLYPWRFLFSAALSIVYGGEVVRGHESCILPASENIFIRMLKCRQPVKSVFSLGRQAALRWIADTVWFDGSRETDSTPITIYIRRYRTGTRCRCNSKGEEGKSFSTVNATCN